MENEDIKKDQGTKINAKNQIIMVVTREMKAGILIMNKQSQIQVKTAKNHFFAKQTAPTAM